MTFRDKFLITLLAVLAVLFALGLYGYLTGAWEEEEKELKLSQSWSKRHKFGLMAAEAQPPKQSIEISKHPETCMPEESRERVRGIMLDAVDDALHEHIKLLFEVWMKDDRSQPQRAGVGARQGIKAHQMARKAITSWDPPECPP